MLYDYEIAAGFNNIAGVVNVETITVQPPRASRVPLGNQTRYALSGKQRTDGQQIVIWQFTAASHTNLDDFITTIFGDYETETAEVTIGTRNRDNTFSYYNALAYLPLDATNYRQLAINVLGDLEIRFRLLGVAS